MKTAMMVAMAENGVIGNNNQLPWHLPEDLKYFKQTTMGKPVIMGRKTFDSIGKALPGRLNIVVSRNAGLTLPEGVVLAASVEQAIDVAKAQRPDAEEIVVMGGEQIYKQAFALADKLYITKVHSAVDGDAYFTGFDANNWQEVSAQTFLADDKNPYDYSFCVFEKC